MEEIYISAALAAAGIVFAFRIKIEDKPGLKALKITALPFAGYVLTTIYC